MGVVDFSLDRRISESFGDETIKFPIRKGEPNESVRYLSDATGYTQWHAMCGYVTTFTFCLLEVKK